MELQALLKTPQALPAVPEVAAQLIATFEVDDVDLASIARLIAQDPVLSGKLLQQANSSFFRRLRPAATVQDALAVLGLNKVRALVLAATLNQQFARVAGVDLPAFWNYSLATAALARYITEPLALDDNIAFTTGLLHAVGELVLHMGMPVQMANLGREVPLMDLKRAQGQYAAFGYSYAEVGAALAQDWRLPKPMVDAVRFHAHPLEASEGQPLAAVLHLAAWRARAFVAGLPQDALIYTYPDTVGLVLDVDPDRLVPLDISPLQNLPSW